MNFISIVLVVIILLFSACIQQVNDAISNETNETQGENATENFTNYKLDISQYYNTSSNKHKISESDYNTVVKYVNETNKGNVIGEIYFYISFSGNYSILEQYGDIRRTVMHDTLHFNFIEFNKFDFLLGEDVVTFVELGEIRTLNITNELNASELKDCEMDSDCVAISPTCCGCTGGGVETTINKKYKREWDDYFFLKCPGPVTCLGVMGICVDNPKCIDNKCTP